MPDLWPGCYSPAALAMVDNEGQWGMAPHISLINRYLLNAFFGEGDIKSRRLIFTLPPRHAKPLSKNTMVLMADGTRKKLGEIYVGDEVITHRGVAQKVMAVHEQGILPILKIQTELGRSVLSGFEHPFLTAEGWKKACDLDVGDGLAVIESAEIQDSSKRKIEEFKLLGYLMGDGHVTVTRLNTNRSGKGMQNTGFCNQDQRIVDDFSYCVRSLGFSISLDKTTSTGTQHMRLIKGGAEWVRNSGISGMSSKTKRVPDWVYRGSKDKIAAFVAAYFDCDGTVNKRGNKRRDCCAEFSSISKGLLEDVQQLLTRLGVRARLAYKRAKCRGQEFDAWRLAITSINDAADFWKAIPLVGNKSDRMNEWKPKRSLFKTEYASDRIVSIDTAGEEECRCLTVDVDQTFIAEDLVVHNSEYISRYLPAWYLGTFPRKRVILSSFEASFAMSWGRKVQDLLRKYQQNFGIKIREDVKAGYRWETHLGGGMITSGVAGMLTGRSGNLLIVDDPVKNMDMAYSPVFLDRCEDWFNSVFYTRGEPNSTFIIVMTRWVPGDLVGRLIKQGSWTVINLPAIAEENDILGRKPGEALWPDRWPVESLMETRKQLPARIWEALYQQHPSPDGGAIFNPGRMGWYVDVADGWKFQDGMVWPHSHCSRFAVIDPSVGKKRESDPTAIGVFGYTPDDRLVILEMLSERVKLENLAPWIASVCRKWGVEYAVVESNGFQIMVVTECRKIMGSICPVREVYPHGKSKIVRAMQAVVLMDNGQIYLPKDDNSRPEWVKPFLEEITVWVGDERQRDDRADVLSYAARQMIQGKNLLPTGPVISELDRMRGDWQEGGILPVRNASRLDPFSGNMSMRHRVFGF